MSIGQDETGACTKVAKKSLLDMRFVVEWLLEKRIILKVDLSDREIVGGSLKGLDRVQVVSISSFVAIGKDQVDLFIAERLARVDAGRDHVEACWSEHDCRRKRMPESAGGGEGGEDVGQTKRVQEVQLTDRVDGYIQASLIELS